MKKHILLLDESVTVQKVVSLTLDQAHFKVIFAKSKQEALQQIRQSVPSLILVSDQVSGVTSSFPKEIEAWLGRHSQVIPPCVLISSQGDTKDARHYAGILKKPFSPPQLKAIINDLVKESVTPVQNLPPRNSDDTEEQRLHGLFDETFNDEEKLTSETFQLQETQPQPGSQHTSMTRSPMNPTNFLEESDENDGWQEGVRSRKAPLSTTEGSDDKAELATLWSKPSKTPVTEGVAQPMLEKQIQLLLNSRDLTPIIDRILEKMIPPIVEKMVNERLDHLLKDSENVA